MRNRLHILLIFIGAAFSINAAQLDDARELYLKGDYAKALPLFLDEYKKAPKNASLNHWIGASLINTGQSDDAKKYLEFAQSRGILDSPLFLAEIFYNEYDFKNAELNIERYQAGLKKAKKSASDRASTFIDRFKKARTMLDHVEKIQIIDSIVVDKNTFLKAYKIAPESGSIKDSSVLPQGFDKGNVVFMPESKERMMWAISDSVGDTHIVETTKLFDGKWDKYAPIDENLKEGGSTDYPFMLPDGTTLYYASNGKNSIGGYDIFLTRKDTETGKYLQPQNIGMPFNSPYDDYMLTIDEFTGVGTWASDRNKIPGKLTLYTYIINDVRENYNADTPNLEALAAIKSIKDTWNENADYSDILETIKKINPNKVVKKREFTFAIANDVVYISYDDFKSTEAKNLMQKYESAKKAFENDVVRLKDMRRRYATIKSSLKESLQSDILQLEKGIERQRIELENIENSIRRAEQNRLNL